LPDDNERPLSETGSAPAFTINHLEAGVPEKYEIPHAKTQRRKDFIRFDFFFARFANLRANIVS
jgi:hypothetical protein